MIAWLFLCRNLSLQEGGTAMKKVWRGIVLLLVTVALAAAALAQPPTTSGGSGMALLNLDNTVALHGYDPVSYFKQERPRRGNRYILERVGGATYFFASRANRYTFLGNAPAYQPQFGGFCTTAMAQGRLEDIDPEIFFIFDGKLYLFRDEGARAWFLNNPRGTIAAATHNYFETAHKLRTYY
jgi:YHS domain-containing protein